MVLGQQGEMDVMDEAEADEGQAVSENAKSHGSRLRRGAALPSNPRARWVTQGRQRPIP